jgi:hypothetical protein
MPKHEHAGNILMVPHLLEHLGESKIVDRPLAHVGVWFRGQPNESWDLVPGVYRDDFPEKNEEQLLRLERHLARDFRVMSAGIRRGDEGEAELYFLQQHYRMRTRLLDWTNNPLAGLYFAVSSYPNQDGALFVMDANQLGPSQGADFDGIFTSREPPFQEALKVIFHWPRGGSFPEFIIPVRPDYFDPRITLQRGCFTFHVPKRHFLTVKENDTLISYVIPKTAKPQIAEELAVLGIDDFSIYGDLEHLSARLKRAYKIP